MVIIYHVGVNCTNHAAWAGSVKAACILLECLPFGTLLVDVGTRLSQEMKKSMVAHRDHSTAQVGAKKQQVVE